LKIVKIAEVKNGMRNVSLKGKIVEIFEVKQVYTRYGRKEVANATLKDDSGEIILTLWESQIDMVSPGDNVKIEGAFITEFKGKLQVNVPRSGKIEVI